MAEYLEGRIEIIEGDITRLAVDAIVNAANESLYGITGLGLRINPSPHKIRIFRPRTGVKISKSKGRNSGGQMIG